jgi:hypothetical protein
MRLAFALALVAALPATAQQSPRAAEILDAARAECIADVKGMDADAPTPELLVENEALSFWDLDEAGVEDDAILDFNFVFCSLNYSLWHGSGGSVIHVIHNGTTSRSWTGGLWEVADFNGSKLLLIGRHGTWCDGYGAQPCVQAIALHEGGFSTVLDPLPLEERPAE